MSDEVFSASGVIKLEGGVMDGRILGWKGDWPPPERLMCAQGKETGLAAIVSAESGVDLLPELQAADASVTYYIRISSSKLPDDVVAHPHLMRVALYGYDGKHQW